jgi:hypothetical protein
MLSQRSHLSPGMTFIFVGFVGKCVLSLEGQAGVSPSDSHLVVLARTLNVRP